jgi:ADP-ribosyl-[dinitrogen reductase] hydrolase
MSTSEITLKDRILGALLGGVTGDAFGSPYEFKPRGTYVASRDMAPNDNFGGLPRGSFTDDSSMMLCLAKSLTEKGFDSLDQMHKYSLWRTEGYMSVLPEKGCFDIGRCTSMAISDYLYDRRLTAEGAIQGLGGKQFYGLDKDQYSGNGGIMRIAPAIIYSLKNTGREDSRPPLLHVVYAVDSSRVTHASPECLQAAALMAQIMYNFFKGRVKDSAFISESQLDDLLITLPSIRNIGLGTYKDKSESMSAPPNKHIYTSGYVVHSLEAALWAFDKTDSFEEGMILLAGMGHDVDTVCCIYGQIAGSFYGYGAIPTRWLNALQRIDLIAKTFIDLYLALGDVQ